MTKFANRIIEILRNAPNGLTAKEVAERLGATRSNIGSQLNKLAAYGIIKKARGRVSAKVAAGALYRAPSHDASQRLPAPDYLQKFVESEIKKQAALIKAAGVTGE